MSPEARGYARLKRALDVGLVVLAGAPALAVGVPVAVAVAVRDGRPVLYRSRRLGRDRREFTMLKFRTMRVDAPDLRNPDGTTWSSAQDPRVTPLGRVLRRTSLDELPQLINVLRGDMSLVGPRPSPPDSQGGFRPQDFHRYDVRPGITGLAQAELRNSGTLEQRLELDSWYAHHHSLRVDLQVLRRTVATVLARKAVYRDPGATS